MDNTNIKYKKYFKDDDNKEWKISVMALFIKELS